MTKVFTGQHGRMQLKLKGGTSTGKEAVTVRNWSFSHNAEVIDATVLGNNYRQKLAGLKSISGSAQLLYYTDDSSANVGPVIGGLNKVMEQQTSELTEEDTEVTFFLAYPASNTSGVNTYRFPAILTSITVNCAVGDVVTYDVTFEGMDDMTNAPTRPFSNV